MTQTHPSSLTMLLRLRRQREDRARRSLLKAEGHAASARRREAMLRESLAECNAAARQSLLECGSVRDVWVYRRRVEDVRRSLRDQAQGLAEAGKALAAARLDLARAIKERRALDRLSLKARAVAAALRARREQKELDEMHAAYEAVGSARSAETSDAWDGT